MTAYYIVNCSTDALNQVVQFFGVATEDDYSFWPLGHARLDHIGYWSGNFDTKPICEKSIDDLIMRIHKRKGINCEVRYMKFRDFRELVMTMGKDTDING